MNENSSRGFSQDVLKVALTEGPQIRNLDDDVDLFSCSVQSTDFHLVQEFIKFKNTRGLAVFHHEGEYGSDLKNGSWSGVVGSVQRKEADVGAASLGLDYKKMCVVDFTFPYLMDFIKFFTKTRKHNIFQTQSLFFLKPFPDQVWGILLAYVFVYIIVKIIMKKIYFSVLRLCDSNHSHSRQYTVTYDELLRMKSFRLLVISGLLCHLLSGTYYSSQMTSTTSINVEREEVKDWDDLRRVVIRGTFFASSLYGTSTQRDIEDSDDRVLTAVGASCKRRSYSIPKTMKQVFTKVRNEKYVFILPEMATRVFVREHHFDSTYLHASHQPKGVRLKAIALRKGFPHTEIMNILIIRLMETGVVGRWNQESIKNVLFHSEYSALAPSSGVIGLKDFRNLCIFHLCCCVVCLASCLVERYCCTPNNWNRSQKRSAITIFRSS